MKSILSAAFILFAAVASAQTAGSARGEEPCEALQGEPGTLVVDSEPSGATISVNTESHGTTPTTITNVTPGPVLIVLRKKLYDRKVQKICLKPGENKDVGKISLGEMWGEINLKTAPSGAMIYHNGQLMDKVTPIVIQYNDRTKPISVRLVYKGYRSWEKTIDLQKNPIQKFDITLEKE